MSRKFSSLEDIYDFYQDGGTLASLTNLTQQDLNDLHSYAYTAYQSGDVITARNLFHLLTYLEHWNYDYTLSLGLCHQRLSNHEDAQLCFARCATLVMQD
ncbi:SycD/LcrH family type III secretion system chaperone CesD, partial [Escherichia coli]